MRGYRERMAAKLEMASFVDGLLQRMGLSPPFSLQELLAAIEEDLGTSLRTFRAPMPAEIGGLGLADERGRSIILVNRRRSLFAEDYTILHELGHLVLGHLRPDHVPGELDEWCADLFAQTMLDRMLRRPPRRPSSLERLKAFFGV